ncbi:EAL domain-containing protein [Pseudoalteromonas sp. DL2-H2.2]|uniref:EAL domain-containing protein n=1 Tax=Pseudoalteromonas sp. DL2-H2.2 TaxID=2908889 RepID=UPI001F3D23EF|nr:EAL domain-containing protein [Pseudoalteromonas sp. DL2-H2.2]MCF2910319.1 EAL domain-containing protein [Pseudoalteromonas sp. DL2-H2.2]
MTKLYSIDLKFWLTLGAFVFAALLAAGLMQLHHHTQKESLLSLSEATIRKDLSILNLTLHHHFAEDEYTEVQRTLSAFSQDQGYKYLALLNTQNDILYSSGSIQPPPSSKTNLRQGEVLELNAQTPADFSIHYTKEQYLFRAYVRYKKDVETQHTNTLPAIIYAEYSIEPHATRLLHYNHIKIAAILAVAPMLTVMVLYFTRLFIHRPVTQLMLLSEHVSRFDFSDKLETKGTGEFKRLADNLNNMARSLQNGWKQTQQAEAQAKRKHEILEGIFAALPDLFFVVDREGTILEYHCGQKSDLFVADNEFMGRTMQDVLPSQTARSFHRAIHAIDKPGQLTQIEYALPFDDGNRHFEARLSALPGSDYLVVAIRNITDKKRQEEIILHHAFYDTLTDLPNRFLVLDRLQQLIHDARRDKALVGVGFIDLDDFKKVNDSMGHEVGDKVLIHSAQRLKSALREKDTVARLGGDEFIILLGDLKTSADIHPIAAKLVKLFHAPFDIDGRAFNISLSLGIAIFPQDADTPNDLLRKADSAMYNAKQQGRNTYCLFTESMSNTLQRRLMLEESMQGALERGEFEVYYQPQLDLQARKVVGAEALLRWHSETLGPISPAEFIPLAEQTGFIIDLGKFVLNSAASTLQQIHTQFNTSLRLAVNLSPRQFNDPELLSHVEHLIAHCALQPGTLELEITEGLLLSGDSTIKATLNTLQKMGVLISMDDFGTGYSSLNYLRQYPFDVLKIDQSFIADMHTGSESAYLVKNIITMAHGMGLKVIAEGIEDHEQLNRLVEFNCNIGQGYLIGQPMPQAAFQDWLEHNFSRAENIMNKSLSIQDY